MPLIGEESAYEAEKSLEDWLADEKLQENKDYQHLNDEPLDDTGLYNLLTSHLLKILEENSQASIVTFTGGPASGKTTLSQILCRRLMDQGYSADFISTDGFNKFTRE